MLTILRRFDILSFTKIFWLNICLINPKNNQYYFLHFLCFRKKKKRTTNNDVQISIRSLTQVTRFWSSFRGLTVTSQIVLVHAKNRYVLLEPGCKEEQYAVDEITAV